MSIIPFGSISSHLYKELILTPGWNGLLLLQTFLEAVSAKGSSHLSNPIDVGKKPLKSTTDPIVGVGFFMLNQTCAPFLRH